MSLKLLSRDAKFYRYTYTTEIRRSAPTQTPWLDFGEGKREGIERKGGRKGREGKVGLDEEWEEREGVDITESCPTACGLKTETKFRELQA